MSWPDIVPGTLLANDPRQAAAVWGTRPRPSVWALVPFLLCLAPAATAGAAPSGGDRAAAPLETWLDRVEVPEAAGRQALEANARALALAISAAKEEVERLEAGVRYLRTRHVQKMQVSWSACGGRRLPTESPSSSLSLPLLGNVLETTGVYRFPGGAAARPGTRLERYVAFAMNRDGRILGQFRSVETLPAPVVAGLNSVAAGFHHEAPDGSVYARYFDFLVVTPDLQVVAGYRYGPARPDGLRRLAVFPPEAAGDPRAAYPSFARHGPTFPAVITRRELSPGQFQRYQLQRQRLLRAGQAPDYWLQSDLARGRLLSWESGTDAARYLAGTRHVLLPDVQGFVSQDVVDVSGKAPRERFTPRDDLLVVQGTEMAFGQRELPGIGDRDERLEELYRRGGALVPEPQPWKSLQSLDRTLLQERPLKAVIGRQVLPPLQAQWRRRVRQLQERLDRELDPRERVRLDRELYCARQEFWWRDEEDYLFLLCLCPEEEAARWRRAQVELAVLSVRYALTQAKLIPLRLLASR